MISTARDYNYAVWWRTQQLRAANVCREKGQRDAERRFLLDAEELEAQIEAYERNQRRHKKQANKTTKEVS